MLIEIVNTILYYLVLLGFPVCGFLYGYLLDNDIDCDGWECELSKNVKYGWFISSPFFIVSYIGLFIYPAVLKDKYGEIIDLADIFEYKLIIRIVTKGISKELVLANISKLYDIMKSNIDNRMEWVIEVVTDNKIDIKTLTNYDKYKMLEVLVPKDYETENGTLYKARALHYVSKYYNYNDKDWILHLDEESKLDVRTLQGVMTHIMRSDLNGEKPAIGQGVIIYAPDEIQGCVHLIGIPLFLIIEGGGILYWLFTELCCCCKK